jgi:hypothetical protein
VLLRMNRYELSEAKVTSVAQGNGPRDWLGELNTNAVPKRPGVDAMSIGPLADKLQPRHEAATEKGSLLAA